MFYNQQITAVFPPWSTYFMQSRHIHEISKLVQINGEVEVATVIVLSFSFPF